MPKPVKRFKPTVQLDFFGKPEKTFFGRSLAEKLARKKVIAKSRRIVHSEKKGASKTINPVIEGGELFESLSRQGFQSAGFADFLARKNSLKQFFSTQGFFERRRLVEFALKNYFPNCKDATAVAKVKPLLLELAGFVARQVRAKDWRWASRPTLEIFEARQAEKEFKRRVKDSD